MTKESSSSAHKGQRLFGFCGAWRILENPESNEAWEQRLGWIKSSQNYRNFHRIDGEPTEFEWNISQDSIRYSSAIGSKVYCTDWEKHQKISQEEFYSCRCSTTFLVERETMKKNVWQMPDSYLCTPEDFGKGHWSFIGSGSEKKWYCISEDSPQGVWGNIAERMLVEFAESDCPIFRDTCPLSRGQLTSKGHGQLSRHYAADLETIETIFRIIVSANQLSLYGAVEEMCEEY